MAKIKVTSQNVDTKANTWLNSGTKEQDQLVYYNEGFKYAPEQIIRLAFDLNHIVRVVTLEGKINEVQYISGTI
jgi:hypothetical protein